MPEKNTSEQLTGRASRNQYFRTPRLESLEGRRVMAANITQFTPTDSGFIVQFSEAIDASKINLYTTSGGAMGAADVTVQGATTGAVKGTAVFSGTTMTFVASGGVLPADTYTVTLRSAADGFTDAADGELLDGERNNTFPSGNGTAGGNFVTTFTVSAGTSISVGFADIARGPGQALQGPAAGSGTALPEGMAIQLSNAAGVTSVTLTFNYDASLMSISEVKLGPDAPTGSQIQANTTTPGVVTLSFFALSPLTADQTDIVQVIATVPEGATYGKAQILDITSVEVNAGALTAKANDAIHVAAYPGDVNANRRYDAEDARLIARVGVGSDTGFVSATPTSATLTTPLFPLIDPLLLGDVTGADGISPLDASDVLRKVINLSVPNIPNLPSQSPTNVALSSTNVATGAAVGTTVGTFTTTDPDTGDTFTYSLVTGTGSTDNSSFTISGNQLRTAVAVNSATKSSYAIRVRTTDASGKFFERAFTITVGAANQAPTDLALSASSIAESQTTGAVVGNFTTTDADAGNTFTYTLVTGTGSTDNSAFTINNNQLVLNTTLNFENKSSYAIRVRTTDNGGATFEKTFTIAVTNVNEAPTLVASSGTSVPANAAVGTTIGTLSTTDPDASDTHTYTLVSGTGSTDNAKFTIVGNQLRTAALITGQTTFSIRVRSTDAAGLNVEQVITGTVVTGNVAPTDITLSSTSVAENAASGTTVGNLTTSDPNSGDTHTYTLVSGTGSTDNSLFTISGNQLRLATTPNFESKPSYSVRIQTTDNNGLTFAKVFTINVTNVNEAPTLVAASSTTVPAGATVGTAVGTLTTTDPDAGDTHTYTLVSGTGDTDNAKFSIVGNQLRTAVLFSGQTSYSIRVRATDAGGLTFDQVITGTVSTTANAAPTDITLSSSSVAENTASGTTVGNLSSVDSNSGDTHTYALVDGEGSTDNSLFTISGNQLRLATTPNFEAKPSYSVRVRSTDAGGLTFTKALTITVTNVNEAPTLVASSGTTVPANAVIGAVIGTLSATDPDSSDTHTFTLVAGTGDADNAKFTIVGNQLRTAVVFTTQTTFTVRVRATDAAGLNVEQVITGTVVTGNVAPTDITLSSTSVAENAASGTTVGNLTTSDPNSGDTHTYTLVSGTGSTDNSLFTISGNQLRLATTPNFESKPSYSVRIQTTDNNGLTFAKVFTINVTNVNEAPTLVAASSTTVPAGATVGTAVGTLTTTDPDAGDTHTYTLVSGTGDTDNAKFSIVGNQLRTAVLFSGQTSYSIRVRATDAGGLTFDQVITGTISTTTNAAPTDITLSSSSVAENTASGTTVGNLSSVDSNSGDTHTYALVDGEGSTDNSLFTISGNQLRLATTPNFEAKPSYSVRVRSTDAGGLTFTKALTIAVTNVNEAPTQLTSTGTVVPSGAAVGTTIGTLSTTDPDAGDTHTYTLVSGTGSTDNAKFTIVGNQLRTATLITGQTTFSVRVRSTDAAGLNIEQVITGTIATGNAAPTDITLSSTSVAENAASGTTVGNLTTSDPNSGDTHTYTLVSGTGSTDNSLFTISGNQLRLATTPNFESKPSYSVRIQTTDNNGLTFAKVFTINVTNVNEAPTLVAASSTTVPAGATVGTTVGTLTTTDPDAGDTHTYTLVSGTGDTDNAKFSIVGNQLRTAVLFSGQTSYSIRVRATDAGGLTFDQVISGTVTASANAAPTDITLSSSSVAENTASGATVGNLTAIDTNVGDTHTFTLVAGDGSTDNGLFTITGNQLKLATTPNFEAKPSYSVRIQAADNGGLTFAKALTISVTNVNEAPTLVTASSTTVPAGAVVGTTIGTLSTTDPDAGDTHTYTLVSGTGDTDNAKFTLTGNQLKTAVTFGSQTSYSIRVRSTDAAGLSVDQVITGTITPSNVAPTDLALSSSSVAENTASGTTVGTLTTTDANAGDTHTYALVAGAGDTDNSAFTIVGNELKLATTPNFETKASYSIRIQTTDAGGLSTAKAFTINVTNVNEAPTALALSDANILDGDPTATQVGIFSTTDPDSADTFTYSLVAGAGATDNASFTISGNQLRTAFVADRATKPTYAIRVRSQDAGGLSFERTFTISVDANNQPPTGIQLTSATLPENAPVGTVVGTLSSLDPNVGDTHTYSLVVGQGDTDNALFQIAGNELRVGSNLNFETKSSYAIRVRSTDQTGLSFEAMLAISVTNVNEAPTDLSLSASIVAENVAAGSAVGLLSSVDPDSGDTHTYSLVAGTGDTDNAAFSVDGNTLRLVASPNFEAKNSYSIRLRSTDAGGLSTEKSFVITVTNVNEAPGQPQLSVSTIVDGTAGGQTVGTISSIDPDAGDTLTYSLVAGDGDADNGAFTINGNELEVNETVDLVTKNSYSIRLRATDASGLTSERSLVLTVTEEPVAPTAIELSNSEVDENVAVGTVVGQLSSTDENSGDTHTYALVAGNGDADNAAFEIVGNQLRTKVGFDFEEQSIFSIRVRTTDSANLTFEESLTIDVIDVNESPGNPTLSINTIEDGTAGGEVVATISSTDPDAGDTLTYSLVAGEGDADNGAFSVSGDQLVVTNAVNLATKNSYAIRLRATDAAGLTSERSLVLTVTEAPVAPTAVNLSANQVAENLAQGTVVGLLSSVDANTSDTHVYALVAGTGDTDNAVFQIVGNELRTAQSFNFEAKSAYSVRIRSTDSAGLIFEQAFVINITNVNEAPTAVTISDSTIDNLQPSGTVVGVLGTTDPDAADTFSYSLVAGAGDTDNNVFQIVNGQLVINENVDAAIQSMYSVRVRSVDAGGLEIEQILQLIVGS